ncbi:uncharacterized protein LOC111685989 isoform X3 [Lucilia cuprina]|uniref:uncharacterized protein LOC111685989 isoform X3 n=1 Tax=Lucilia cuprina TaxID=7375 RepID=UPI001F064605|nr:uncharacterized protein LOC111685989 isoform X3 [Lucilia cuprina]
MRKLVICLLVFGLYAIQTVVGHMNSDPAPGRSPGPPVDFAINPNRTTNDEDILDNNTSNNINNNNVHVNNEHVATTNAATAYIQSQQQQIEINHKNDLQLNHNNNNNEPEVKSSDTESLNDSYRHLATNTKFNVHNNDEANKGDNEHLQQQQNKNVKNAYDEITTFPVATETSSRLEDAINFQLTNENNYRSSLDNNQQKQNNDETTYNYPTNNGESTITLKENNVKEQVEMVDELEQLTLQKNIDLPASTHEKLRQHTKTIPAISTQTHAQYKNGNMETSSTSLFSPMPASSSSVSSSSSTTASSSSSSSSTSSSSSSTSYSSCHSDLNDFLNDATVIEVDDDDDNNNNDSVTNASNTSSSSQSQSLPPLLHGFKIQLQLYHDVFDASTAFGINCGLLYKIRLTTSLPTLTEPLQSSYTTSASSSAVTPEMQNPTIRQYTGDFFVDTVSLLSSQERGSFVTNNDSGTSDDANDSNGDGRDDVSNGGSSSENLGNKLPISWFATSQHTGNWQMKNSVNTPKHTNAQALTKNLYNTNAMSDEETQNGQEVDGVGDDDVAKKESLEVEENVDNIPSNGFYKATKNGFKLRQRQKQQHDTNYSNNNSNKWHYVDNVATSSSSSSTSTATKKKRRKSAEIENTTNICSSENKWQGKTKSNTNTAGGISTESLGLWLVNELCEQDDTIEFRVFFRLKFKTNNLRSNSNSNSSYSSNNVWLNASDNMGHRSASATNVDEAQKIVVYRKTFQFKIRKDCHLILRETSMGTLDYTILPLYCIDCTVHFPSYKHLNNKNEASEPNQPPPGMLVELQRLNVPCASGGYVRFSDHKVLCGKLEELEATDRVYHFNVEDDEASVQFYRNPMFSLSYKLVDYCYNVNTSNGSGEFYIRPSMKDTLECYFRIHLPYGNRVLLRMVTNNDSDILPMPTLMSDIGVGDAVQEEELYTIFTSQGTTVDAQVINLTVNSGNNFGAYSSFSSSLMPFYKLPDMNATNNRKLLGEHKAFASLGLDSFGFLAATKANLQMAFSGTANCVGVVIKVFENDHSKWSHCVNNTKHMRGFILESSSNTLSVHLFRAGSTSKEHNREESRTLSEQQINRPLMPAIYLSYQARPLTNIVSNCAFGWIAMEQFCIAAIELSMNWHEAEKHCSKLGGHLVSVRNEQQQQTINELLLNSPGYTDQNAYWVGGSDKSYEGDFRWSDGLIFQYTNWFPGWSQHGHYNKQPNDDGLSSQDCIELRRYFRTPPGVQSSRSPLTNKYMWNDRDCSANNFLICERAMSDDSLRRNWINDCNKTVSLSKEHPRASIWSPSFPRQYPDNANCFTTITAPAGYRIVIEFEELVIENEQGCTYDYLEITEPKHSESLRTSTKSTSSKYRYAPSIDSNIQNSLNLNLKFNYNNPNLRTFRKRSSYDSTSSTSSANSLRYLPNSAMTADHVYAPQNTDYNGYDLAQNNYQKLLQIYSSLYSPRNNFIIQTPDYPKGNPYLQHPSTTSNSHNHHSNNNNNNKANQEVLPKRLCGDWSTKLKLLRYVSTGSYLGLHFVSDYSHHFGGYKAKTYMENRSHSFSAASECSNERLKPYNGSCYLFVSYPEVDWWTAQQVCRGMGAKLTSVSSADEHRFITSNIRNQIDYSPQLIYWLGAELEKNGQFEWTDDSKMSFQGWLPGQGQFDAMPSDATCLGLQWKMSPTPMLPSGLYWQSQKCNKVGGYVCKKPKESFGNFAFSNFTVTGTEGRLVSPAYPNTYPLNIDYWIHIKAAERTRIIVQFQKIDLEPQDECLYDFISIQDYDIVSKIILEPGTNTVPMAMLMSDEQFTAYENDNDNGIGDVDGGDGVVDDDNNQDVDNNGGDNGGNNDATADDNDNSSSSDDDADDSDDNGANDNETTTFNKRTKKTNNPKLQLQHLHQQQQQQPHVRMRRSLSVTYKARQRRKLIERQTQSNSKSKSQNRKRRRKRNHTAKLQQDTQNFHHLAAMHHKDETVDTEPNLQKRNKNKYNKNTRSHHDSNNNYGKIQHQQQQHIKHRQTPRKHQRNKDVVTRENQHGSSSCINENPKRCRRKKSATDIENLRTNKALVKLPANIARYRRSTILSDNSLPASDNAQSFLPYVRWCGSHESNMSKFDFVSRSNEVMLNFHSDYSITGLGFAAVWKAIDVSGCPLRTLTSREGTIFSPNYPHFLLNNLNCAYVIQAPVGKRVWLEFIEYDFQSDALLEVDIGNGVFRPFRLSDHLNDGMFVSLREQLKVQFRTGQHPRGKGFQAIYHTVAQMERRERIINLTSNDTGYLYQLNYPHDMAENVDYTQHLVAPFGHNILLELHGVEFTENGCQDNNLLEIYDNYADNNGTKWQLCKFQNANFHTGSPLDDNYLTTNIYGQHPGEYFPDSNDNNMKTTLPVTFNGNMETSSATTVAEFLLRQHQQHQQQYSIPVPASPPPVYITSYLNTLYIRQRTTAKSIANLNCSISLQWDNNYKIKLASGDKSVESCQPNPCQYNGKCVVNNRTSYCQCLGHYTGRFCGLNLCELEPCVFGKCELTTNNFKCQCQPGYMGTTCEQKQRPCADNPCEGRGICIEKNGGFFCRCYAWWEGHRCEKRMLHIPYKPLSERMLQEPFWLGLITVFVVLAVIGLVWCAKRHFPEKIEKLLAEEADRNRPPGSIHGHHHHTSLREQLQFTTAIPQTTVNNAPGAPRSIFNRLGIRKPSLLSLSSPNPVPGGGGAAARTFSLDDLLRPPPRRSPSPRKKRNNSTPVKKNAAEKKQILQQLVSPAAQQAKPKVSLGELISMSENRLRASNVDSESDLKETTFSENTGSLTSATVERAINDPKLEKKVTFARLLNKVSAEMSSGSEATRNSSALSLPTDIQMRASSMPPSPCTNDMRSPHSTSSTHGSDSFSSSDLALTDFGLRSIQTSGSEMGSTTNNQLSGLPTGMPARCRIGSPARPKVSSADSILAMFRNFANAAGNASNTTTNTMPSTTSVFVSPSTTPTVSSPQDDAPGDDESSTSSMHTPVSFSSGAPDSPVFYRQTTIEVPVLDVLNAHKTSTTSTSSSSSSNLLHPPTILLEIPSINNKCLSPIREMPTPIPSPALTPIMTRPQRSNSPIFQEDPSSGGDFSDDDDKSDRSDTQLSEKLRIGLQREKSRLLDTDVETTPTDTTTTSIANLNKPIGGLNYKIPKLSFTPAIATAAPMQTPAITIDIEPPTPEEKQARPRDLIIPTLTVEQPSPTKNRHPMIIFPGSPPPQRASIGETSFMFPNKQQQKRLLKQFEKPTSLDFPFAPPTITVTANMSELESDTEPLSPAPKTGVSGGLMPPNPVGMCYLSPFTMCTRADRTISESNLSSSGYSSMASPGPSRCGSSNPLYPNEMDEPGSGHTGPGLSLHVNLLNRRKSSMLPSCKENISNGKCTGSATGANTDRLHTHRPRSDSETFSDDILIESNDEGIGTDHVDEKLDDTRLSSRRFDMFLDDEILIEVDEPPSTTLPPTSVPLLGGNNLLSTNCGPQMAQLQLPSIVIQIDGCGDKTLSPVSSRSESPLSERAGIGRFSPHFYGRKDQLPFTDSDGLYDFPSSDGKGTSVHTFSHQRRSSSKKRERKSSKCSSTQSPTKQQLDLPSKESLNTSSTPSSITHICNKHCHSHHHPCPAVTVTTRKSPKRRLLNRHPVASSSSSSESLNSAKELTVRPLPRRLNSPNREKRPRKQESLSEDEVADSILRRISPSIVKTEDETVRPKCKINRLRAIGNQIRFLRRLEKSIKTRERIASPSDSCPEENTDDMDSPQASSPLLQPTSPSKTRLALCRQKRLPSGTYGITAAALNSSNWKGMDRSLIGDDLNSD